MKSLLESLYKRFTIATMDQSLIIVTANDPFDASAFTRLSLGIAFIFGLVFAILSAILLYYIKRQTEGTDKVLNMDENYLLFNCGPGFKSWGWVVFVVSVLLALTTGISWLVLTLQRPPVVMFYAQGTSSYTPCIFHFYANQTNMADVKEIRFDFGDGKSETTTLPYASHTYMLSGPVDTEQFITVRVEITTKHNEKASNYLILKLRNGFPQPKLTCRITTPIKYAYTCQRFM